MRLARSSVAFLALVGLALAGAPALAQTGIIDQLGASGAGRTVLAPTQGPPVAQALSGPIDPAEYIVGPGDILQINLSGGVNRSC